MPLNTKIPQQIVSSTTTALSVKRGEAAMLVADMSRGTIVLMDGKTYGGIPAAREDTQIRAGSSAITVNDGEWSALTGTINIGINPEGFIESAVSPDDKVLAVGDDGKITAQLSVSYDEMSGLFSLKGKDGEIISSFTLVIPTGITPRSVALVENPESQEPGLYLEFVFIDDDDVEIKLYANMDALKDVYTAGRGITISDDRVISVDEDAISGVIADDLIGEDGGLKVADDKLAVKVDPDGVIGVNENGVYLQYDGGLQSVVGPDGKHMLELGSHASEQPEYGLGDEDHYGHVRLADSGDSRATVQAGIAATPAAVKDVDDRAVHNEGDETISGVKTFVDTPKVNLPGGGTDDVATLTDVQMLVDGTVWNKRVDSIPEDTDAITADMPVGGLVVSEAGIGLLQVVEQNDQKALAGVPGFGIATMTVAGAVQPDTVTTKVDSAGILSAIGGNLLLNSAEWITESGTFTAPVEGWYSVHLWSGGQPGLISAVVNKVSGGSSGLHKQAFMYLTQGQQIPVVIGAGGLPPTVRGGSDNTGGGGTSFGDISTGWIGNASVPSIDRNDFEGVFGTVIARGSMKSLGIRSLQAPGGGPGGGYPSDPEATATQAVRNDSCRAMGRWGGGGAAVLLNDGASSDELYGMGAGAQGSVYLCWHDPAKANGPAPTPALLSARRMAAPLAAKSATVNLYDPETGQGSVWREEDAPAKLAEGLITEAAWQEICAVRAAEDYATWLADPETEAERFEMLRGARDAKLAATDYIVAPDYPLTDEQRAAVIAYRQALRDLPAEDGAPWDGGGELTPWPEMPNILAKSVE